MTTTTDPIEPNEQNQVDACIKKLFSTCANDLHLRLDEALPILLATVCLASVTADETPEWMPPDNLRVFLKKAARRLEQMSNAEPGTMRQATVLAIADVSEVVM